MEESTPQICVQMDYQYQITELKFAVKPHTDLSFSSALHLIRKNACAVCHVCGTHARALIPPICSAAILAQSGVQRVEGHFQMFCGLNLAVPERQAKVVPTRNSETALLSNARTFLGFPTEQQHPCIMAARMSTYNHCCVIAIIITHVDTILSLH